MNTADKDTHSQDDGPEAALFDVVIRPYRSLSRRGFKYLMTAVAGVAFVASLLSLAAGLWPVLPFFGGEVLLIYWAFRSNYRDLRASESVRLTTRALRIERTNPAGRKRRFMFAPPHWLQVDLQRHPDGSNKLVIRSHGRTMTIAQFLSPREKVGFAEALRAAIGRLGPAV